MIAHFETLVGGRVKALKHEGREFVFAEPVKVVPGDRMTILGAGSSAPFVRHISVQFVEERS